MIPIQAVASTRRTMRAGLAFSFLFLLGAAAFPEVAAAQSVEGTVRDAGTDEPLAGVALELLNDGDRAVAQTESDAEGKFLLLAGQLGDYRIRASRLGYEEALSDPLTLQREVLEVEIVLSRSPLALDPVTVVGRRHDPRHDATFEGALARKMGLPDVGPQRVILRDEPEIRASGRVVEVLRGFPGQSNCVILYQEGNLVEDSEAVHQMWLDSSTAHWEAVEYYSKWEDAPLGLQGIPSYVTIPMGCTVVALWGRLGGDSELPTWKRALQLGGVLAGFYLIQSLVGG